MRGNLLFKNEPNVILLNTERKKVHVDSVDLHDIIVLISYFDICNIINLYNARGSFQSHVSQRKWFSDLSSGSVEVGQEEFQNSITSVDRYMDAMNFILFLQLSSPLVIFLCFVMIYVQMVSTEMAFSRNVLYLSVFHRIISSFR